MDWTWTFVSTQAATQLSLYLPRILGGLLVLVIGAAVARILKRGVVKLLEAARLSQMAAGTPVEHFLKNADIRHKIEEIIGSIIYWLLMLVVLHTAVAVLDLEPLSEVLGRLLSYIPRVFSAVLVLFLGVLLAGVVESLVKGSIRSIDGKSARLLGKVSSYLVMTITLLAAIAELGIASQIITILLVGFVASLSLGFALALGLGGQDVIRRMLNDWYERMKTEVAE